MRCSLDDTCHLAAQHLKGQTVVIRWSHGFVVVIAAVAVVIARVLELLQRRFVIQCETLRLLSCA